MLSVLTRGVLVFTLIVGFVFSFSAVTLAQDEGGTTTETVEDTTTEEVIEDISGILPTNPFYFFKEFTRGFRRLFILDPVRRAEFELRVLEEKAEELEIVERLNPDNVEVLNRAIENYNENVDRLKGNLERLSDNPNVEELLQRLDERTGRHNELFDELLERHEGLHDVIEDARHRFEDAHMFAEEFRHRVGDDGDGEEEDEDNSEDEGNDADTGDDEDVDGDVDESRGEDESREGSDLFRRGNRFCMELYNPVCGRDGRTYSNECFAEIADVDISHRGACIEAQ